MEETGGEVLAAESAPQVQPEIVSLTTIFRGSKVPRPAGPQCAVGTTTVPVNAGKVGAPGQIGRPIEKYDTYAIAGLVVWIAGAFLNGVGVCFLFVRRGNEESENNLTSDVGS